MRLSALVAGVFAATLAALPAAERLDIPLGLDNYLPVPEDNPLTREKVELGRRLFNEKQLSRDGTVACSTCHDPKRNFTDDKPLAEGVFGRIGARRVPAILNRAYGRAFFWDGRIPTLEEQVLQPIINDKEMDMTLEEAVARLREDEEYAVEFDSVFGHAITEQDISHALASYVRTILAGNSRYDRYLNGEGDALTELERRGLEIFRGKGNCTDCHLGPNLSDEKFRNTGIAWKDGELTDLGRFRFTKRENDRGSFKTPTLRNAAGRAPYMHDGSLATLSDVADYYNRGGNRNPWLDRELLPLRLTDAEKEALVAFLHTLTGPVREGL
ncbi:MAG: c-type cytochrome [Bryobacterales bacterium]|nr:c-type cytochrome [Bryobacterales bacterium]MDE0296487.1 c-type cytochrome [Bryobacterales bacterium]